MAPLNGFLVAVAVAMWSGGWGGIFAQTGTEREAEKTLRDLKIAPSIEPNVPIPEIYTAEPKIVRQTVAGVPEWRLFYFCRYHTSDDLAKIIHEQFATKLFDPKGKSTSVPDYTVTASMFRWTG